MQISIREFITALHGMGFGALFLLAFSGLFVEMYHLSRSRGEGVAPGRDLRFVGVYVLSMAALAWAAVLSGAYFVYPWYRAKPPVNTMDLTPFPQRLLLSHPTTAGWHNIGMEWKEHVAWFAPIAITMVAFVLIRYSASLARQRSVRVAVLGFATAAFLAAGIAGFFGAFLDKRAPVQGGAIMGRTP